MKTLILLALAIALSAYGWRQLSGPALDPPADSLRWNPFALKRSGLGKTLARVFTEEANTSYHHGLFESKPPIMTNPLSHWLDTGVAALGFAGRLRDRPPDQYPLRPYEVREALAQTENKLRLAFELDPGNYTAYDVYFFFLTNEVTQTEFASLAGAQFKDNGDDEAGSPADRDDQKPDLAQGTPAQVEQSAPAPTVLRWSEAERRRRAARAIQITDLALRAFRPDTLDPERFLTAAVMWYNRFMLTAPDPAERRKTIAAREKFDEVGYLTLSQIEHYLEAARVTQHSLEQKGTWQSFPERRVEFLLAMRVMEKCAFALSSALAYNRSQLSLGLPLWRLPGTIPLQVLNPPLRESAGTGTTP